MTQDPYGQPPGSGYFGRGEVVPDDEANVTSPTTPMTHFQKVASALRGDRTDPAMPVVQPADLAGPGADDLNGTSPDAPAAARDDADAGAAQVGVVRSPDDDAGRDYWDEADRDGEAAAAAPLESAPVAGVDAVEPDAVEADVVEADAVEADVVEADAVEAGPADVVEPGPADAVGPGPAGKHAGAPAQEGLRPGESDHALGDFSDLAYGSLLPDAAEFKTQWQQVQFRFVDDPQGSVTEAADVISQVTAKLEAAIAERQRAIAERQRTLRGRWSEGKSTDTESLRETLLMYRAFLDQLTGSKTS
jgi:hypothetical protein